MNVTEICVRIVDEEYSGKLDHLEEKMVQHYSNCDTNPPTPRVGEVYVYLSRDGDELQACRVRCVALSQVNPNEVSLKPFS